MIHCFQDFFVNNFDKKQQFNNQIIFKLKNLNVDVRNAIKLNKKIHQLKTATIKIAIIIYLDIISFITIEISKQNFNNNSDNSDKKNNNLHF